MACAFFSKGGRGATKFPPKTCPFCGGLRPRTGACGSRILGMQGAASRLQLAGGRRMLYGGAQLALVPAASVLPRLETT